MILLNLINKIKIKLVHGLRKLSKMYNFTILSARILYKVCTLLLYMT